MGPNKAADVLLWHPKSLNYHLKSLRYHLK